MLASVQSQLTSALSAIAQALLPQENIAIKLERPKQAAHGDVATNLAMQLAKKVGKNPRELAGEIAQKLQENPDLKGILEKVDIAGPGFINLTLTPATHQAVVGLITQEGTQYGHQPANGNKLMVEFVSANPTGPLHLGHARQAALGDSLCRLFSAIGTEVHREFYYNDAGNQINNLVYSVQARAKGIAPDSPEFPADGYRGDYIMDIANAFMNGDSVTQDGQTVVANKNVDDEANVRAFAVAYLRREQDEDLKAFGLKFDQYYLESSLYSDGKVEEVVKTLTENDHTYEQDNALWLRTTELGTGDDKDRVMRKTDGGYTYFVPDVAYHLTKWQRGYNLAINIQGSDHHGTCARVKAGLQGLNKGISPDFPQYVLHKMVKVMKGGSEVKISKRAGGYVTMRDLIDWVGRDVVRFFLIQRRADTEFMFDLDLALSKSDDNPVYYIQYAHARLCKMLRDSADFLAAHPDYDAALLTAPTEMQLMKRLAEYPALVQTAAQELAPHLVAHWLLELAGDLHTWYSHERVMVDDAALKRARLQLAKASAQVIANGLDMLGVSAPEQM